MRRLPHLAFLIAFLFAAKCTAQVSWNRSSLGIQDLENLAIANGLAPISAVFPLSVSELRRETSYLPDFVGSPDFLPALRRALSSPLEYTSIGMSLTYQRFCRSSESAVPFPELFSVLDPVAILSLAYVYDGTAIVIRADAQKEYAIGLGEDNLPPSFSGNPLAFENNLVREGYWQQDFGAFEMTLGRQRIHIGPSPFASLYVSDRIPFLDAVRISLPLGPLKMSHVISSLENREAAGDVIVPSGSDYGFSRSVILYNIHYFEYSFGPVRAGIGAQVILIRPQNAFQLADFFPVFSWHNGNIVPNNMSLIADISVTPFPGLNLYFQYGLDEVNANLFGVADSEIPTIDAYLGGIRFSIIDRGFSLLSFLEAGYTHYLWGSYNDAESLARGIYRLNLDGANQWLPLTSPFGPGAIWLTAALGVRTSWGIDANVSFQAMSLNTLVDLASVLYTASAQIENAPRIASFRLGCDLSYFPADTFGLSLAPAIIWKEGAAWFEVKLGMHASLDFIRDPPRSPVGA